MKNNKIDIVTTCCESLLVVDEQEIKQDELGLHIVCCPYCNSSCDIVLLEDVLISNGTRVIVNGEMGTIYENDACDTEELNNINYSIILDKDRNCNDWNNKRLLLRNVEFEIIK